MTYRSRLMTTSVQISLWSGRNVKKRKQNLNKKVVGSQFSLSLDWPHRGVAILKRGRCLIIWPGEYFYGLHNIHIYIMFKAHSLTGLFSDQLHRILLLLVLVLCFFIRKPKTRHFSRCGRKTNENNKQCKQETIT